MSAELVFDNSAWSRFAGAAVARSRSDEIAGRIERREIGICVPFLLEAGFSARSAQDHAQLVDRLLTLPFLHIDGEVETRAIDAQGQLARVGHHRVAPSDLMIAAIAERHGVGVLHYDRDYDVLREKTDLRFESVWLAERGTL